MTIRHRVAARVRDWPIPRKLALIAMISTTVAMAVVGVVLLLGGFLLMRRVAAEDVRSQAHILSLTTNGALAFDDAPAAESTLRALEAKGEINEAAIFANDGALFARFSRDGAEIASIPPYLHPGTPVFTGRTVEVMQPITVNRVTLGTLYLRSSFAPWWTRLLQFCGLLFTVQALAVMLAHRLSRQLHRTVTAPIGRLQGLVTAVARDRNYSLRAHKEGGDEVGALVLGFNDMLGEIERRENELVRVNASLVDRTLTLQHQSQALAAAKEAADEASRAKSAFLANMSHELRTPLNAILGYSELIAEVADEQLLPDIQADARKIHRAGSHLTTLINDILDLAKIEAGRMEVTVAALNVPEMARDLLETIAVMAKAGSNALSLEVEPEVSVMRTDERMLRQILLNLLSNACKFTKDGTVCFRIARVAASDGDRLAFIVADSGVGIPPAQLERIFEEFHQVDSSSTRKYAGTGLGLAISSRMAGLLGGDITVKSTPGAGSTFTLLLPATCPAHVVGDAA